MNKKLIFIIITIALLICLFYLVYRFQRAYKAIEVARKTLGYRVSCKNLPNPVFKKGKWKGILIDADITYTDGAHNIVPYDLDKDGKKELIADSYRSDTVMFYKCKGNPRDSMNWSRYVIDSSVGGGILRRPLLKFFKSILKEKLLGGFTSGAHYTAIADITDDGRDDLIVAGDYKRYDIILYETPEDITNVSKWKKYIIHKNKLYRTYYVEAGDIDGDGYKDIIFATKTDNSLGWLKNNRSLNEWPITWIDKNCVRCFNVRVSDINKDGQNDIIASEDDSINGGKLHLYRYSNNPMLQEEWIDNTIATFPVGHGVSVFEIMDIDKDGDLDIISGNNEGDVYVLDNPYPDSIYREWNKYKVNNYDLNSGHDFREIDIGDIDRDGDLDIIVADEGKNMLIWFENSGNTFYENWIMHTIDKSDQYLKWCHSVELGDIDGDGDLDVAVAAAGSNVFLWYSNEIKKPRNGK
ncbi:MAG: FG-GAP repeat domain-containing protein [Candidatus Helarchaeota archaeon]